MLTDLSEFFSGELRLPYNGKEYVIPDPPATKIMELRQLILQADPTGELVVAAGQDLMGETWDEAIADGIGWAHLVHMARTAIFHYAVSPDVGQQYWHLAELASSLDLDKLMGATRESEGS